MLPPTVPLPATEVVRYEAASPERRHEIEQAMAEIAIDDSNSILFFGTAAQDAVTVVADEMLEGVRNKDTGAAGQALNEMVSALRRLPLADLDPQKHSRPARPRVPPRQADCQDVAAVHAGAGAG